MFSSPKQSVNCRAWSKRTITLLLTRHAGQVMIGKPLKKGASTPKKKLTNVMVKYDILRRNYQSLIRRINHYGKPEGI